MTFMELKNTWIHLVRKEGNVGSYIIIVLLRRFKGEMGESYYLTPVASPMDSGIEVRKWIVLLMVSLGRKGINNGSMFQYK